MSVTLNPCAADPRIYAAAQDDAVWRQLLASVYEFHEPYTSPKLSGEPMALAWINDRLEAVPITSLPHRDPSIVGYIGARHHSLFVYRSDLDVDNWAAWLTDDIVEILAIRQSILEEAGL